MRMKKTICAVMASAMVLSGTLGLVAAGAEEVTELPREETLYFGGQQWGTVNSYNPIGTNQNNAMGVTAQLLGSRTIMFETLYMYNFLDGSLVPLLADGDFEWNDDLTEMTVKLKDAAKWSDGTDVTSNDVIRTFDIGVEIANNTGTGYGPYIDSIEAIDDKTFVIKAKLTEKLREKMIKELDEGISHAQLEVQQIEIQAKRAIQENEVPEPTVTDIQRLNMIKQHFGEERQKRLEFIAESQQRREDAQKLVLGAEIVQGTLERQVEVHVGDDMRELMNVEVLVEDDKIVAIRG